MSVERYTALALQTRCDAVNQLAKPDARAAMMAAIERIDEEIRGSLILTGPSVKLVVLPEYFLTAYPVGETIDGWADKAAISPGGPEYEALSALAQKYNIFLSGNVYETDDNFPGYYFQASFVIDARGEIVLRYRRLLSMFAPTPHDVWDKYVDLYGLDAIFPVADTELGKLACIASEEILFPEITRMFALRGAEVIIQPTSEVASPEPTPKEIARRARAQENLVYVVAANTAGIYGEGIPSHSVDGMSTIVDYRGRVLVKASTGETMTANAEIDLAALRAYRAKPGMPNYLVRQRLELFASTYSETSVYAANSLLDDNGEPVKPERAHFIEMQRATIARLSEKNLI